MCHKCTLYIHFWKSNVHSTVHRMYSECAFDVAICCMYKKVHQKSASKKVLKKCILCTTKVHQTTKSMHPKNVH
jgi:hypothetical protein